MTKVYPVNPSIHRRLENDKEPIIETEIELALARRTYTEKIKVCEHFNHKDEIIISWMLKDLDSDFGDHRTLRINKIDIPKLIKALEKYIK